MNAAASQACAQEIINAALVRFSQCGSEIDLDAAYESAMEDLDWLGVPHSAAIDTARHARIRSLQAEALHANAKRPRSVESAASRLGVRGSTQLPARVPAAPWRDDVARTYGARHRGAAPRPAVSNRDFARRTGPLRSRHDYTEAARTAFLIILIGAVLGLVAWTLYDGLQQTRAHVAQRMGGFP